ncbi:phosphoribosylaminoimidazolesuccinocarboxamide synthase [Actinokineospora sp. HUAS TT18]|uniref:phosphoribosylaminoimidazolesuccinocarboxamide synthase n=1 Tax=Actinokineospora sp. HUAS TT18 TaxID=3447451 RepID=UPI003F521786
MRSGTNTDARSYAEIIATAEPDIVGRSKRLWLLPDDRCLVQLIPSLRSFTHDRDEMVAETGPLRLDFYAKAAARLTAAGVPCAYLDRVSDLVYLAEYCPAPPFEVIVKNRATGSTTRKYPGLFEEGALLPRPVVKFDYRVDPEDQPIGEDYLRALGQPVERMRELALTTNEVLGEWLAPIELWDFCVIFGVRPDGELSLISEVSQDCMRLRHDGGSVDKDLFRRGVAGDELVAQWKRVFDVIE